MHEIADEKKSWVLMGGTSYIYTNIYIHIYIHIYI